MWSFSGHRNLSRSQESNKRRSNFPLCPIFIVICVTPSMFPGKYFRWASALKSGLFSTGDSGSRGNWLRSQRSCPAYVVDCHWMRSATIVYPSLLLYWPSIFFGQYILWTVATRSGSSPACDPLLVRYLET